MKIDVNEFLKPCSCGRKHEIVVDDIIIESGAISQLPDILKRPAYADKKSLVMICDENTYEAAGKQVEELIPGLKKIVLNPENLHANEHGVEAAKKGLDEVGGADLMIAVGSGTIHDITRYHAYEMKIPFFSVPTAASVDGFVSTVAAMTWHGFKKSFTAVSPVVVVADTDIFKKAPLRLTASGVSDLLGKYTALADWKITHLLTGEYICDEICSMEYEALDRLKESLDGLTTGDADAYENLMYGLLLSGLAMQMTGNSRPASGAEHHMSHLWEMEVINGPLDALHGEKVSVGTMLAAREYKRIAEAVRDGKCYADPYQGMEEKLIRDTFGKKGLYEKTIEENTPDPMEMVSADRLNASLYKIADIIDEIPEVEELDKILKNGGCVRTVQDIGLTEDIIPLTMELSPYVRNRLSFMRVRKMLNIEP